MANSLLPTSEYAIDCVSINSCCSATDHALSYVLPPPPGFAAKAARNRAPFRLAQRAPHRALRPDFGNSPNLRARKHIPVAVGDGYVIPGP